MTGLVLLSAEHSVLPDCEAEYRPGDGVMPRWMSQPKSNVPFCMRYIFLRLTR